MKNVGLFLLLVLFSACQSDERKLPEGIEVVPVECENPTDDAASFLEKIEIVPLETNDSSLIPTPGKVIYNKKMDIYATKVRGQIVYTFSGDGEYIGNSKKKKGQGPEDYFMALDIQFNPDMKGLDLLNPYGTIYTYSPTFEFLAKRKYKQEFPVSRFIPIDSVNYILAYPDIWTGEEISFENVNTHQKTNTTYHGTISVGNNMSDNCFYKQGEQFYFVPFGINYYLYKVDVEKKKLVPEVYLDFGEREVKEEELPGYATGQRTEDEELRDKISNGITERFKFVKDMKKTTTANKLFNKDFVYVFFFTYEKDSNATYIYNRKTKKGFLSKNGKPFDMYYCFGLEDNVLFAVCQPEYLQQYVCRDLMTPEEIRKMEQLKEDDNPVIIKYYLKK